VRQNNFVQRMPEVAAAQVVTLLRQGNVGAAARLVQTHDLPISQARVFLKVRDLGMPLISINRVQFNRSHHPYHSKGRKMNTAN
jgi:LuxR family transcriptional regulator, maltose regulon positive regulatory protein